MSCSLRLKNSIFRHSGRRDEIGARSVRSRIGLSEFFGIGQARASFLTFS